MEDYISVCSLSVIREEQYTNPNILVYIIYKNSTKTSVVSIKIFIIYMQSLHNNCMLNKRFVWNFEKAVYTVNSAYLILIIKRKRSRYFNKFSK